jgi:cyclase
MAGYVLSLAEKIRHTVNIPITILGSAGKLSDIEDLMSRCGIIGASAGSLFVFEGVYKSILINYPTLAAQVVNLF